MSDTERPDWLCQALQARARSRPAPASTEPTVRDEPLASGQVRRLDPMDPGTAQPQLVLLTEVDFKQAVATVLLLSGEVDSGSDVDRLLSREVTGLGYDLVALSDVGGPAWLVQLGPLLTVVNLSLDELPVAGIALRGEADARWTWKEGMIDALIALTAECRFQLIDGESPAVVDPVAFDLLVVDVRARSQITLAAVHMLEQDTGFVPAEALDVEPVGQSSSAFESFAALWRVVGRHRDRVLPPSTGLAADAPVLREVPNDPLPAVLSQVAARLDSSVRCIHIATVSSLWGDQEGPDPRTHFREVSLAGRRHQLVVSRIDLAEVRVA